MSSWVSSPVLVVSLLIYVHTISLEFISVWLCTPACLCWHAGMSREQILTSVYFDWSLLYFGDNFSYNMLLTNWWNWLVSKSPRCKYHHYWLFKMRHPGSDGKSLGIHNRSFTDWDISLDFVSIYWSLFLTKMKFISLGLGIVFIC